MDRNRHEKRSRLTAILLAASVLLMQIPVLAVGEVTESLPEETGEILTEAPLAEAPETADPLDVAEIPETGDPLDIAEEPETEAPSDAAIPLVPDEPGEIPELVTVTLPAIPEGNESFLDFTADPYGLIDLTDAARYGGVPHEPGQTLYFKNAVGPYGLSHRSDPIEIRNDGEAPLIVDVTVQVVHADGILFGASPELGREDRASMYLALFDGEGRSVPLDEEGAVSLSFEAVPGESYAFGLEGACNPTAAWDQLLDDGMRLRVDWSLTPVAEDLEPVMLPLVEEDDFLIAEDLEAVLGPAALEELDPAEETDPVEETGAVPGDADPSEEIGDAEPVGETDPVEETEEVPEDAEGVEETGDADTEDVGETEAVDPDPVAETPEDAEGVVEETGSEDADPVEETDPAGETDGQAGDPTQDDPADEEEVTAPAAPVVRTSGGSGSGAGTPAKVTEEPSAPEEDEEDPRTARPSEDPIDGEGRPEAAEIIEDLEPVAKEDVEDPSASEDAARDDAAAEDDAHPVDDGPAVGMDPAESAGPGDDASVTGEDEEVPSVREDAAPTASDADPAAETDDPGEDTVDEADPTTGPSVGTDADADSDPASAAPVEDHGPAGEAPADAAPVGARDADDADVSASAAPAEDHGPAGEAPAEHAAEARPEA